jgi:hypothetical protein
MGAGALGTYPTELSGAVAPSSPGAAPPSVFPELNDRALGWLQFLWEKSTTQDNWSRWGMPHP